MITQQTFRVGQFFFRVSLSKHRLKGTFTDLLLSFNQICTVKITFKLDDTDIQWICLRELFLDGGKVTTVSAPSTYDNMCSGVGIHDVGEPSHTKHSFAL